MEEFIDLKIRKFQQFIIDYINSVNELPIEIKRLVVMEILHELELNSDKMIDAQQKELRQKNEVKKDAESIQSNILGKQTERQESDRPTQSK